MAQNKQYLISFLATLKGDKLVVRRLKAIERQHGKVKKSSKSLRENMSRLGKRALLTIPIWFALRNAFMAVNRAITETITTNLKFEESLARIETVVHGEASTIKAEMAGIKQTILNVATKTDRPINELAEAFYFLRTSNLETAEAMALFEPTVNAMIGTGNDAKDTARALAGIYNTLGKRIKDTANIQETAQRIGDVLTFTYATQDVQLQELVEGYTKLAPYVSGLDDSFSDIIATIGFLNTKLLRSGRTGRLTGRSILQLTKNASKLASEFGIVFDPDKPISFIDTLRQLNAQMGSTLTMTARQQQQIQEVFATRGGVPIRLLLDNFEEFEQVLNKTSTSAEGFAEKMKSIRMRTINAQMRRMRNIFMAMANDFISGIYATGELAGALQNVNDNIEKGRKPAKDLGLMFGFVNKKAKDLIDTLESIPATDVAKQASLETAFPILGLLEGLKTFKDAFGEGLAELTGFDEYVEVQEESIKAYEDLKELAKKGQLTQEDRIKNQNTIKANLKRETMEIERQVKLMKARGKSEAEILKYKEEAFQEISGLFQEEDKINELYKIRTDQLVQINEHIREMEETFAGAQVQMLEAMGANELQILDAKKQQLRADRDLIGEEQYILELARLRTQEAITLQQLKLKEKRIANDLYLSYEKASAEEKGRLRRMMELRLKSPDAIAKKFRGNMFDRRIITQYWNHFSQEAQDAIGAIAQREYNLPTGMPIMETGAPEIPKNVLPTGEINAYWREWITGAKRATDTFSQFFKKSMQTAFPEFERQLKAPEKRLPKPQITADFGDINLNFPMDNLEDFASETANKIKGKILSDENLQRKLAKILRPYI